MTEQPVETEQQFLGNETHLSDPIVQTVAETPFLAAVGEKAAAMIQPRQHHVPNAHLLRRPSWAPVDDVELGALVRKSSQAAQLLAIAKGQSIKAEEALQLALGVEDEAAAKLREAEDALVGFTRKGSGL
jgi:hypothetical protein